MNSETSPRRCRPRSRSCALGEISDAARRYTQADILRLYEIWLKTGSPRARGLLHKLGVTATPVALAQN